METLEEEPEQLAGYPVWRHSRGAAEVAAVGRGAALGRADVLRRIRDIELPVAWLKQIHGANWLEGTAGCVGEADALVTDRPELALAISTADCVPVVLATSGRLAAVHAGWRGIVAGVIGEVASALETASRATTAWIGPAIGPCCYEVGPDVEQSVAASATRSCVVAQTGSGRTHLDLQAAVHHQLERAGVTAIDVVRACTHCRPDLHSFRRDGAGAGRNLTFAWLSDHA
jgi:YfiH family protein